MKLLVDMNLAPRWIAFLADAGFEAVHWSTVGASSSPDSTIMAFARADGFVVLTQDLDFGAMLAATRGKGPSVLQIRSGDVRPESVGLNVISALRQMAASLDEGALITVDAKRTRLSLLPLRS